MSKDKDNEPVLIYTTFETANEAESVGRRLVEERLAACVNILPGMTSVYEWNGDLECSAEVVMLVKTLRGSAPSAMKRIRDLHSYEVPALLVIAVETVDRVYGEWLTGQIGDQKS